MQAQCDDQPRDLLRRQTARKYTAVVNSDQGGVNPGG
jgi:hypothetical protein